MTPCPKEILYPSKTFEVLSNALITYDCVFHGFSGKRSDGKGEQTFVDLGCGNGLLVHLLNSEGVCSGRIHNYCNFTTVE